MALIPTEQCVLLWVQWGQTVIGSPFAFTGFHPPPQDPHTASNECWECGSECPLWSCNDQLLWQWLHVLTNTLQDTAVPEWKTGVTWHRDLNQECIRPAATRVRACNSNRSPYSGQNYWTVLKIELWSCAHLATLTFYAACAVRVTIFSTGGKFRPVPIFT